MIRLGCELYTELSQARRHHKDIIYFTECLSTPHLRHSRNPVI